MAGWVCDSVTGGTASVLSDRSGGEGHFFQARMEWACQTDGAENEWTMNELMSEMNSVLWERLKFDKQERELAFLSMSRERRTQE